MDTGEDLEPIDDGRRRPLPRDVPASPLRRPGRWPLLIGAAVVLFVGAQAAVIGLLLDIRSPLRTGPEGSAPSPTTIPPLALDGATVSGTACPGAEHQWRTATPDGLPAKADAVAGPAEADLPELGSRLRDDYGVTDLRIEQRPWRVWSRDASGAVIVEFATIPVIVATLLDPWRCPDAPLYLGAPVEFVLRAQVTVPDVVGLPLHTASAAVFGAGLRPSLATGDPDAAGAEVLAQDPPAGMFATRGTPVGLRTAR